MSNNNITGDAIKTKLGTKEEREQYAENFDAIFRKPKVYKDYTDAEILQWKWNDDLIELEGYEADKKLQQEKDDAV